MFSPNELHLVKMQGVGSAVNKLNDVVAMIAEVRNIANSLNISETEKAVPKDKSLNV